MIENSRMSGSMEKKTKSVLILRYIHESRTYQRLKRHPKRCRRICSKLKIAKDGATLIPIIIIKNSKMHRPI